MDNYIICDECGGKMHLNTIDQEFHFNEKDIVLKGLNAYICDDCGEVVFEKEEVKMIEQYMKGLE